MTSQMMPMRGLLRCVSLAVLVAATSSCGNVVRTGRSPVMLIVSSLQGSPGGGTSAAAGNPLASSVISLITSPAPCTTDSPCRVIFSDNGSAVLTAVMKDTTVTPTTNNQVTISGYHVE